LFIQRIHKKTKKKVYTSVVLMENYREGGKIKHRIISNLSKWDNKLVCDFEKVLKGEKITSLSDLETSNGKSFGALQVVTEIAGRLGIKQALGNSKQGKLALFQIAGRIISQGSRNYLANEWALDQAHEDLLKLSGFNEDNLYDNLDWLAQNQSDIEKKIFGFRYRAEKIKDIFLYDVTSSYLEGNKNELGEYGYNRDKKKGKKQIVIGLMLDSYGYPLTIMVFKGNTNDTQTVSPQLEKLKEVFGIERVIFVGDKGMIKSGQIDQIISEQYKWNYLTTITKQQINTLLKKGTFQLSMFDDNVVEVQGENGERYILRKNKHRAKELEMARESKIGYLKSLVLQQNTYLKEHPKAKEEVATRKIIQKANRLKLKDISIINSENRTINLTIDQEKVKEHCKLDGCYVVKTNAPKEALDSQTAHDRYKELSNVEFAFRTIKTTIEEIRPIFVRKEDRTRGHVFIAMLAYMIIKYITDKIGHLGYTRNFAIETLDKIQYIKHKFEGKEIITPPKNLSNHQEEILNALGIKLK
jgi:transposase